MEFFGCTFIAFGVPCSLFIFTITKDPLRIIVLMASAFFWLISLLLSSILWFAVVPLRDHLAFGLVFSVLFQEIFRFLFYILIKKADEGLKKVSQQEGMVSGVQLVANRHLMAYVAGLGYGIISGAFSLINVLADSTGPGTMGINGNSSLFFITSAFLTLCFILLHTTWGVIFFNGIEKRKYFQPILVVFMHMLVSCLTLLNQGSNPVYLASVLTAYIVLVISFIMAFIVAGGSFQGLKAFCLNKPITYTFN